MKKFFKILAIGVSALVLLCIVALVVGFVFLKNFKIEKYKPQLIKAAEQTLGRTVDFKEINLTLSFDEGVRVGLTDLSVGENPDFGAGPFLKVAEVKAGLDIRSLVSRRKIFVPNILIRSPRVNIIRNAKGFLNVQTIGSAANSASSSGPSSLAALPAVLIKSFKIADAQIHFVDQPGLSGQAIAVTQLNVTVSNFSLTDPFEVLVDGAVLSSQPDFKMTGKVQVNLLKQQAQLKDFELAVNLNQVALADLSKLPMFKGVPLPQTLKGRFTITVKESVISDKGLDSVVMGCSFSDGEILARDIAPGISVEARHLDFAIDDFSLMGAAPSRVSLKAALYQDQTNVDFQGDLWVDQKTTQVRLTKGQFTTDLAVWPLVKIQSSIEPLRNIPLPAQLSGNLQATIKDLQVSPAGLSKIILGVKLADGGFVLNNIVPGSSFTLSKTDLSIQDFSMDQPFAVAVKTAYLHDEQNISTKGTATLRLDDQSVLLKDLVIETDLSTFAMAQLKSSVAALKDASLPEKLQGQFKMNIAQATVGPKGLVSLTSKGSLDGGAVQLKELIVPVEGVNATFALTQKDFTMSAIQAKLGKGQITAQGGLTDYLTAQNFVLSAELKGIELAEILDQKKAQVKVEGLVSGKIKAQGRGVDVNSMAGEGTFAVKEAKLKDLNVLKTVLDKISFLPNVSSSVEGKLADKYKAKLNSKDTTINTITTAVKISEGAIVLDPISVEADEFVFSGKCQSGFDQKYIIDGAFKIPEELSGSMVEGLAELQYLCDKDNNISLPVHVSGQGAQAPAVSVTQTAIDMTKNAIRNEGKNQLEKVLQKTLGVENSTSSGTDGQQQDGVSPGKESPASTIINTIFDKVLK